MLLSLFFDKIDFWEVIVLYFLISGLLCTLIVDLLFMAALRFGVDLENVLKMSLLVGDGSIFPSRSNL